MMLFLIFVSVVSWWGSISAFSYLNHASLGTAVSEVVLKVFAITAGVKKYKSIKKKEKKKHDKIVLLVKTKSSTILSFDF